MSTDNLSQSWQPPISQKQSEIINEPRLYTLVTGPRKASKTIGCLHAVAWYLWSTLEATGMMLGKTISDNLNEGAWSDLVKIVLPQWFDGGFGMKWITEPRQEGVTRRYYFDVTNMHGGVSRLYLDSLDEDGKVESKFKGKRFGLIYITELSNFKSRSLFDVLQECLRCLHLQPHEHRLIADTNPSEEGQDSWIYDLWYWFRTVDLDNLDPDTEEKLHISGLEGDDRAALILSLKDLQSQLAVHEFTVEDNVFLSAAQKARQRAMYAHNKDLYDRYYLGKWIKASTAGVFSRVWKRHVHVIDGRDTGEIMLPEENCGELGAGWDIGPRNCAITICEKINIELPDKSIKPGFKILDEYVVLGEEQKLSWVVEEFMEMMDFWEFQLGKRVKWTHWSDRSSFDRFDNIAATYEHKEVLRASKGRIALQAAYKADGSVEKRVDLMSKLLLEDRIWVNYPRCIKTVEMFECLKRNARGKIDRGGIFKHAFDSASYYISMECWHEMYHAVNDVRRGKASSGKVITTRV